MKSDRRERVFLVRIWHEGDAGGADAWRGSVHDVSLGQKRYITAAQEIADFVALRLAATASSDDARAANQVDSGRHNDATDGREDMTGEMTPL